MISKLINRLFFTGMLIAGIYGVLTVGSQCFQKPVRFSFFGAYQTWLARPGIKVTAIGTRIRNAQNLDTLALLPLTDTIADSLPLTAYPLTFKVSQGRHIQEDLWVEPAGNIQWWEILLYEILRWTCITWLLYTFSCLFRNFDRGNYFSNNNIVLMRRSGWLLLIPQIASMLLYGLLLIHIHPVKLVLDGDTGTNLIATYELQAGIEWVLFFLGLGMLVLSYIFKNGLQMKEHLDLTA